MKTTRQIVDVKKVEDLRQQDRIIWSNTVFEWDGVALNTDLRIQELPRMPSGRIHEGLAQELLDAGATVTREAPVEPLSGEAVWENSETKYMWSGLPDCPRTGMRIKWEVVE